MKKVMLLFVLIMLLPGVFAVSLELKGSYRPGESFSAEISGNLLSAMKVEDVQLVRGHVAVPWEYGIEKLNETYYLWGVLPYGLNNYTLVLSNIKVISAGVPVSVNITQNISVSGEIIDYSIKPSAISTNGDFVLSIKSNKDGPSSITTNLRNTKTINLVPGENKVKLDTSSIRGSEINIVQIGMYSIPVYVRSNLSVKSTYSNLMLVPSLVGKSLYASKTSSITLINQGDSALNNIAFNYDSQVFSISPNLISKLDIGKSAQVNITLLSSSQNISKEIYAKADEASAVLVVDFSVEETQEIKKNQYYCSELRGVICTASEVCSGDSQNSIDGICCLSNCKKNSSGGSGSSSWVGYLLVAILILAGAYVYYKYKKAKGDKDPIQKKIKEAEKVSP